MQEHEYRARDKTVKKNEPGWTEGGKSAQQKIHPGK